MPIARKTKVRKSSYSWDTTESFTDMWGRAVNKESVMREAIGDVAIYAEITEFEDSGPNCNPDWVEGVGALFRINLTYSDPYSETGEDGALHTYEEALSYVEGRLNEIKSRISDGERVYYEGNALVTEKKGQSYVCSQCGNTYSDGEIFGTPIGNVCQHCLGEIEGSGVMFDTNRPLKASLRKSFNSMVKAQRNKRK